MGDSQRSAQMLLDYDNMYRELYQAIQQYNIREIPALFKDEEPDRRALTHYRRVLDIFLCSLATGLKLQ